MNIYKIIVALIIYSNVYSNELARYSARRPAGVSAREAIKRHLKLNEGFINPSAPTALDSAVPLRELDLDKLTNLRSRSVQMKLFRNVRDTRAFRKDTDFPRRLTWLYPHDGCFMRAEYMTKYFEKKDVEINKVFVFGKLKVKTPYSGQGYVRW